MSTSVERKPKAIRVSSLSCVLADSMSAFASRCRSDASIPARLWEGKIPSGTIGDAPEMLELFRVLFPTRPPSSMSGATSSSTTYACPTSFKSRSALAPGRTSKARIDLSDWSLHSSTRPGGGISSSSDRRPSSAGIAEAGAFTGAVAQAA